MNKVALIVVLGLFCFAPMTQAEMPAILDNLDGATVMEDAELDEYSGAVFNTARLAIGFLRDNGIVGTAAAIYQADPESPKTPLQFALRAIGVAVEGTVNPGGDGPILDGPSAGEFLWNIGFAGGQVQTGLAGLQLANDPGVWLINVLGAAGLGPFPTPVNFAGGGNPYIF